MIDVVSATLDDAELVHALTAAAFEQYRDKLQPPTGALSDTVEKVRSGIESGGALLAWRNGIAIGALQWRAELSFLYVGRLAVLPSERRSGVGRLLIAHARDLARSLGDSALRVEVREALPTNIAFFEAEGFVRISREPHPRLPTSFFLILEMNVSPTSAAAG